MRRLLSFSILLLISLPSFSQNKVLIISTNVDSVGSNRSGTYLMEIAIPFKVFNDRGYAVDVLTPQGGKAEVYEANKTAEEVAAIRDSKAYVDKITNTLSPQQVKASEYSIVYIPGGHGQFFDVASDERIARIIAQIYEQGGYIGIAGHGTASIVNVRLSDCSWLVANKRMTTFPTWAEHIWMNISNYGKLLPFNMADVLERRGADLVVSTSKANNDKEHTLVIDAPNRIVTGAFASSAGWVATETIALLEKR